MGPSRGAERFLDGKLEAVGAKENKRKGTTYPLLLARGQAGTL